MKDKNNSLNPQQQLMKEVCKYQNISTH